MEDVCPKCKSANFHVISTGILGTEAQAVSVRCMDCGFRGIRENEEWTRVREESQAMNDEFGQIEVDLSHDDFDPKLYVYYKLGNDFGVLHITPPSKNGLVFLSRNELINLRDAVNQVLEAMGDE